MSYFTKKPAILHKFVPNSTTPYSEWIIAKPPYHLSGAFMHHRSLAHWWTEHVLCWHKQIQSPMVPSQQCGRCQLLRLHSEISSSLQIEVQESAQSPKRTALPQSESSSSSVTEHTHSLSNSLPLAMSSSSATAATAYQAGNIRPYRLYLTFHGPITHHA